MASSSRRRRDFGASRTQRALCIAAAIAGGLWVSTSLLGFFGADSAAPDPEGARKTIEAILTERSDTLRSRLAAFAESAEGASDLASAEGRDRAARALQTALGRLEAPGGAFLLSADNIVLAGFVDGRVASQASLRAHLPLLQGAVRDARGALALARRSPAAPMADPGGQTVLSDGTRLLFVSGVALGASGAVAVALRFIGGSDLGALGQAIGVPGLRFVAGLPASSVATLPVAGAGGETAGHLAWDRGSAPPSAAQWLLLLVQITGGMGLLVFGAAGWRHIERHAFRAAARPMILRTSLDPLTNLPTDMALEPLLAHEIDRSGRTGLGVALLAFDLAGLDRVNESSGREAVDEVVVAFARRAGGLMRGADTLLRLENDRFAIVQTGVTAPRDVQALARRILDSMIDELATAQRGVRISVSIGIALAPQDAATTRELIDHANAAMQRARQHGGYGFSFYDQSLDVEQQQQKAIEDDLRTAIMQNQLALAFQPLVLADGETTAGVEALVRWKHPERGFIPPCDFIPIAEERGLIDALGEWVLRQACEEGRRWPGITVAVNVSAIQFRKPGFVERVLQIVEETGFEPWRLELELTEGVVVDNEDAAEQAMMELRAAGIRLALDDFGTGYSSLIYLRRFAFDKIKIDKSFLDAMESTGESAILVHSVIHLGRALGLTVTAEGVETAEQHRFLQAAGCHQLQGYLFSKPVPAAEIDARLGIGARRLRKVANG